MGLIALPLLRLLAWAWYLQPDPLRLAWGRALGAALRGFSIRAKVVRDNLKIAYPGDEREQERLFVESYAHLGTLILEVLMLFGPMKRYALKRGEMRGVENWRRAKEQGKGVILVANHVGNWEVMAATGALKSGIDIVLVTKHLKPEWLHQAVERARARCMVDATYEPRTLRDVLTHLRKNGTVGIVLDQYAGPPIGVRVPVFGVPVGTSSAIATLARRTGAIILPVVNYRKDGGFVVEILEPVDWLTDPDPNREIAINTARYAEIVEKQVRSHPEQWLWIHRRFKGDLAPLRELEWSEPRTRS